MAKKDEFSFEIIKQIAVIDDSGSWKLELNIVKFGDSDPKIDIRKWNDDHTKMGKGLSLSDDEYKNLVNVLEDNKKISSKPKTKKKVRK